MKAKKKKVNKFSATNKITNFKKKSKIKKQVTVFLRTTHKSQEWITEIRKDLKWISGDNAYHLLRGVLHALRDQLSVHEAAHLSAQLPMLLRGTFYEGWNPETNLNQGLHKKDFIQSVKKNMSPIAMPKFDLEQGILIALKVIKKNISQGEMKDVIGMLDTSMKQFVENQSDIKSAHI